TIFFSSIVMVTSTTLGPELAFCSCLCTMGGVTRSTLTRSSLSAVSAITGTPAISAVITAAKRVGRNAFICNSLLHLRCQFQQLHLTPAGVALLCCRTNFSTHFSGFTPILDADWVDCCFSCRRVVRKRG